MPVEPSAASAAACDSVWVGRISPRDGCCSGWVGAAVGGQVVGQPSCWPGLGQRQQLTFAAVSVERVPRPHSALPAACLAPGALEPHPGSSFVSVETLSPRVEVPLSDTLKRAGCCGGVLRHCSCCLPSPWTSCPYALLSSPAALPTLGTEPAAPRTSHPLELFLFPQLPDTSTAPSTEASSLPLAGGI